ncbi:MAG: DMT family transporter [Bacteroidaceae bacterium]|nr:DMT family transporter [Bacteroidaceae bacterium]
MVAILNLVIATICAAMFSIFFKIFEIRKIDSMQAIFFNYLTAFVLGLIFSFDGTLVSNPLKERWLGPVALLGFIFIAGMVILSKSTESVGVAISTVCSRASMIIPIILSYIFVAGSKKPQWIAVALVVIGMSLAVWTGKDKENVRKFSIMDVLIPLGVFLCFGLSNAINKLIQDRVVVNRAEWPDAMVNRELSLVTACIFLFASVYGLFSFIRNRHGFQWKNVVGGVLLGIVNYVCTYSLMIAMKTIDSSILFPVHNLGIVTIGALVGWLHYHEKMRPHQVAGIIVATGAICWLCF